MTTRDLLVEIGTEELPPKALLTLSRAFCSQVETSLKEKNLGYTAITPFATPRRLALLVSGLGEKQDDLVIEKFGPAVQAAFDEEGNPTKAASGFARSCGVEVRDLAQKDDGKAVKLFYEALQAGAKTVDLIPGIINDALAKLPIPKRMRWGSKRDEFVRPVHWVLLLFGQDVIKATVLGVESSATTRGHRFHHPEQISLDSPSDYEAALETRCFVIPSFEKRRDRIRKALIETAAEANGTVIIDEDLLDEVTALVEWPVPLMGRFDESFLEVPQEALISSMKEHQKCFHLLDSKGKILPFFITVSNIESRDTAQVIAGNERVISPRLADAAFFFEQDKKHTLFSRREKLRTVIFQQELGTVHDKSERVSSLASIIARELGFNEELATRAAQLGKCDLLTSMVYEFTELQGIMGTYYARADGEPEEVALAMDEQYMPRFSGDQLPRSGTGTVLALAERLDSIAGQFAINQPPTGSKDPFALRRAALGVIRIIIEKHLELDLVALIQKALDLQPVQNTPEGTASGIYGFFIERLRAWYSDQDYSADVFQAVEELNPVSLKQFDLRLRAVGLLRTMPEAEALAAANKRVANILSRLDSPPVGDVDSSLLAEPAEKELVAALANAGTSVDEACDREDYVAALKTLCALKGVIDSFFNDVMVNADDPLIRENRLRILQNLRNLFLRVADISRLQISAS